MVGTALSGKSSQAEKCFLKKRSEIKAWVAKAEQDFQAATFLAGKRKKPVPEIVCFHCQQAAEKYLKGYSVLPRYPGENATTEQAKRALKAAVAVRNFFASRLPGIPD